MTELAEGYDFHHYLSLLGDHPALLRRLGLVIDLVLRPELVGATTEADPATMLRLRVRRNSAFPSREGGAQPWNADVTPAVACRLSDVSGQAVFRAVERGTRHDFNYGLLHLGQDRYTVAAVDVDGLGLKAMNLAATLQRQDASEQRPVEEPASDGIPTVRTGGVALIQTGKAADLHADFYQARRHNDALEADPANPHDLAAEDLVRGYRLDVLTGGTWRSLHQRSIRYAMDRAPGEAFDIVDEGHAQLGVTAGVDRPDAPADPDRPLYVHETLVTWDGWSLAVPRPGHPVAQEPEVPAAGGDLTSLGLTITTAPVPGSLPRLRYLSGYRLRVRPVDLAGNALRPADANLLLPILEAAADPALSSAIPPEPLIYRRFEPVPAPELLPRRPFGPGEGLERLVIRSTPGVAAADYAAASQSSPTLSLRFYPTCDRHLAAPRASLQMVETHGLLDEAIDAVRNMADADAAAAAAAPLYAVATRENGSFRDDPAAKVVKTGDHAGQPNGYVYLDVDQVELPYLPDPLGAGVRVRVEFDPQQPPQVLEAAFPREAGDWYRLQPLRLRLEEGPGSAGYDPAERLVTIALPPGHSARLRLSSLFHGDPEIFGLVDWCRQESELNNADQVLESVKNGTHWMTTPWRDLILIHAVQRPMRPAELKLDLPAVPGFAGPLTLPRLPGETVAHLDGALHLDQASTAEIDLTATWDEVQDDPLVRCEDPAEMVHQRSYHVFALSIPEPFGTPWQPEAAPFIEVLGEHTLGFRTRWDDERPEQRRVALLEAAAAAGLSAPARRRLEAAATQLEKLRGHDLGDTRYRKINYQTVAATRFREYFDPDLPTEDGQQVGHLWAVDVLSCAAPAKPAVLQVLPLVGYEQTVIEGTSLSHRRSLGLRVWLDRGWLSSGIGEMLAVVCDRGGPLTADSDLSREITAIVQDPAHSSVMPQPLTAHSFRSGLVVEDVALYEPGQRRDIAAFAPTFDVGRQAWFCDLEFDTQQAYFPFVRLGLARYQPMSIPGCELSPIVATAFTQTVPNRALSCAVGQDGIATLSLTGPAPASAMDSQGQVQSGGNDVVAQVQAQDIAFTDPLIGWSAVSDEQPLTADLHGDGTATYTGTLTLPDTPGKRRRVVVYEYELHPADDRTADPSPGFIQSRRLVHIDTITL